MNLIFASRPKNVGEVFMPWPNRVIIFEQLTKFLLKRDFAISFFREE